MLVTTLRFSKYSTTGASHERPAGGGLVRAARRYGQDAYVTRFRRERIAIAVLLTVLVAGACFFFILQGRGSSSNIAYSIGDRWTWAGTVQTSQDGLEVTMFSRIEEITGVETKRGHRCWVVKSSDANNQENYSLDYIFVEAGAMYKVISESFSGGHKTGETVYSSPALMIEFPLEVGKRWTDAKPLSGYDNAGGIELISGQRTSSSEVLRKESITVPAGTFECWVIKTTEIVDGTHVIRVENQLLGAQATTVSTQMGWYSESVKNFVKRTVESTTIVTISGQQQILETTTEMNLSSYSV